MLPALFSLLTAAMLLPVASEEGYRTPPAPLREIVEAPPTPQVRLSPDRRWMLLIEYPNLVSLAELSEAELRLGGLRIRPATNGPSRDRAATRLTLKSVDDLKERTIGGLPQDARVGNIRWSPDSAHVAFTVTTESGIEPWIADVAGARARRLADVKLNAAAVVPFEWMPDGRALLCSAVPGDRGAPPQAPRVPRGPVIQQSSGRAAPARTYQDLLKNAHDEALFDYYLGARLLRLSLAGAVQPLGGTEIYWSYDPSPDGEYLLVQTLRHPYSYLVPARRFPRRVEIRDRDGALVRRLADLPLQESVPIAFGSVPTGRRSFGWRADAASTVYWVEALDGGDARVEAALRDRLFELAAPFDGEPVTLATLGLRFGGIDWANERLALVHEWWWKTRRRRTWAIRPDAPGTESELVFDLSWEDRYADPGEPVTVPNAFGRSVLYTERGGRSLLLIGEGASPQGDRPFVDRFDLKTKQTERLFRSSAPYYELPLLPLDAGATRMLTRRESKDEPPNYFDRRLGKDRPRRLTDFPHPTPQLAGLYKEQIRYEREDGVKLTATLYLPPGYDEQAGPLPVLVWAYPQEFKSAAAAAQVSDSPHRFDRVRWSSPLLFLTQGYAVLDDPTMPIIGEGESEPNDSYVEQLVSSARAAVEELVRRGVGKPGQFAIGGHSYGAFMTANLLAHSDLFRAGIARSGAYNRTLTPFGFQAEERSLWEAPEIYFRMSPFMHAAAVDEPLLLIHGDADNNSGTFPMQSERFYNALKGLGATTRLVMLPRESHGYRARESVLHMLWEMSSWLDTHVKNATPPERGS